MKFVDRGFTEAALYDYINGDLLINESDEYVYNMIQKTPFSIVKKVVSEWLKSNKETGAFDGYPEADVDINTLTEDEIYHYLYTWILI